MPIKNAIFEVLTADRLRTLVDAHGLDVPDRRRREALKAALATPAVPADDLLRRLSEVEVKAVCDHLGVSSVGRKTALTLRILASTQSPGAPARLDTVPAAPAPSPAQPLARPAAARRTFVAIDFETADNYRDSACAIALVRVEGGEIVERRTRLIRPPRPQMLFTHIHGLTLERVWREPTFGQLWPELRGLLDGAEFLAAHNAPFDRGVLHACCQAYNHAVPTLPFVDTVRVARDTWDLYPTKLPDVCRHLRIALRHHDAASDAEACARIVIAAGADRR